MDDIRMCTVERIVLYRALKNGSTAQNRIYEGVIVQRGEAAVTDYLDVKANDNANEGWLWKTMTAFDTADEKQSSHAGTSQVLDLRVRRKMKAGQVLQYLCDDVQGDYDLIGLHARILVRLA